MIAPAKIEQLQSFLAGLPETYAIRLAKAVEVDRLAGSSALPHDLILQGLRPVLRQCRGIERTETPRRYFCRPFEDLFSSAPRGEKQKGRIARSSIASVWNWLASEVLPQQLSAYCENMKNALLGYRSDESRIIAAGFWTEAGRALRAALANDETERKARRALGGDAVVADAQEMSLMLSVSAEISDLQDKLPKPFPGLTDDVIWLLRGIYDRVLAACPDAAPYVAVVAMNRIERPWEALKLPLTIARQTNDTLISSTDMGLVGEILFADLESHAVYVRAARPQQFDAEDLVRHVQRFALLSNGMVKEVEMRRDGRWGQRLMKDRAAVAEIMDDMMKRAPREISSALPTLKSGAYAGGPRVPDISRRPDAEKTARALGYAHLMDGCRTFAAAASFGAALGAAHDEISIALKSYCDDIVRELRTSEGERRENAEQYFAIAADLASILFSVEEGEFLRRRGRAATGTQAAA